MPLSARIIDDALLLKLAGRKAPSDPASCSKELDRLGGAGLWLLRREVLAAAAEDRSWNDRFREVVRDFLANLRLNKEAGASNVFFVVREKHRHPESLLRPAFILPVIWVKGKDDSPRLPECLRNLAREVRETLTSKNTLKNTFPEERKEPWGLCLNEAAGLEGLDLSGVTSECLNGASGWGALAAGIILAQKGGLPREDVAVSAAWRKEIGITRVEGERDKACLAAEFGCKEFFLPFPEFKKLTEGSPIPGIVLRPLPLGETMPEAALKELLFRLEIPPSMAWGKDMFEKCVRYANDIPRDDPGRERYLLENITREQASRLRKKTALLREQPDCMVILASRVSAILLSILCFRPHNVLVIHTERDRKEVRGMTEGCLEKWKVAEDCSIRFDEVDVLDYEGAARCIKAFFQKKPDGTGKRRLVDVTGLTSGMTAAAATAAVECGARIVHFISKDEKRRGHQAGTEHPLVVYEPVPSA